MIRTILLATTLCGLCACGAKRIPLTHYMRIEHGMNHSDLTELQYYVSAPITLERRTPSALPPTRRIHQCP